MRSGKSNAFRSGEKQDYGKAGDVHILKPSKGTRPEKQGRRRKKEELKMMTSKSNHKTPVRLRAKGLLIAPEFDENVVTF